MTFHKSIARALHWIVRMEYLSIAAWIGILIYSAIVNEDRMISLILAGFHVLAPFTVIALVQVVLAKGEPRIDRVASALWYWPITAVLVTDTFSFVHALQILLPVRTTFNWVAMSFWGWLLLLTLIYEILVAIVHWSSPSVKEYHEMKSSEHRF